MLVEADALYVEPKVSFGSLGRSEQKLTLFRQRTLGCCRLQQSRKRSSRASLFEQANMQAIRPEDT